MPTLASVARREIAMNARLDKANGEIAALLGIEMAPLRKRRHKQPLDTANQLQHFAEFAEAVSQALKPPISPKLVAWAREIARAADRREQYEAMTIDELKADLEAMGASTEGLKRKAEFVDARMAADGITEEAQAAADGVPFTDESGDQPDGGEGESEAPLTPEGEGIPETPVETTGTSVETGGAEVTLETPDNANPDA